MWSLSLQTPFPMEYHPADPLCKSRRVEGGCGEGVRVGSREGAGDATVEDALAPSLTLTRPMVLVSLGLPLSYSVTCAPPALAISCGRASTPPSSLFLTLFHSCLCPPSDSRLGLHDGHHFQVCSGTNHRTLVKCYGGVGHPWAGSHLHGWMLGRILLEAMV